MTQATSITAHLEAGSVAALRELADRTGRTTGAILGDAVKAYVADRIEFLEFLQTGIDAADRGDLISQEDMEAWFDTRHRRAAAE